MMSATIGEKHISYVACRRCGRIYETGDHRECPDCHGRRRAVFSGIPASYPPEEIPVIRPPVKLDL
jgi:predicted  nucleic acid-binding Zn-ribbon protein